VTEFLGIFYIDIKNIFSPWSESASELHRPSDRRLLAKLVPTFADTGSRVVNICTNNEHIKDQVKERLIDASIEACHNKIGFCWKYSAHENDK
jgi:hypothetical protein